MRMQIIYCEKDDPAPPTEERIQNHAIVCDGETGKVYRATEIKLDPTDVPTPDLLIINAPSRISSTAHNNDNANVIGHVYSGKMYFFESFFGQPDDIARQIMCSMATPEDRARVLGTKEAYDAGGIQPASFNYIEAPRNG